MQPSGEAVPFLLHPPLPLVGVLIVMERGCQQNEPPPLPPEGCRPQLELMGGRRCRRRRVWWEVRWQQSG